VFGVQGGKDLRNPAAAVIADQIHLIYVESIDKFLERFRVGGDGTIRPGGHTKSVALAKLEERGWISLLTS
jgi:hypothetical protein